MLMKDKECAALRITPEFHQLMPEQNGANDRANPAFAAG